MCTWNHFFAPKRNSGKAPKLIQTKYDWDKLEGFQKKVTKKFKKCYKPSVWTKGRGI